MNSRPQTANSPQAATSSRHLAIALVGILALVLAANYWFGRQVTVVDGLDSSAAEVLAVDASTGVTLIRMIGEGEARRIAINHRPEMTVLDAMTLAASVDNSWAFSYQGSGSEAFLTEFGGQSNQEAQGLYWQYEVDGQRGDVSFGAHKVDRGSHILWIFAPYE